MSLDGSSARRQGIFLSYVYLVANLLVQLIYVPLLLSSIGQEEYGLYQLVGSIMSYLATISGILSSGVGRFYCKYKAEGYQRGMDDTLAIARRMYWMISAVAFFVTIALVPVTRAIYAHSFTELQLNEFSLMMVILAVNLVISLNNAINNAVLTANERFVFLKWIQIVTLLLQPVTVLTLLNFVNSSVVVAFVALLMNCACIIGQRYYVKRILGVQFVFRGWNRSLTRGLLSFSGAILLVTLADQIFWKTDQLIIGYMLGASSVAVYSVGASIFMNYMPLGSTVASVFLPRISDLLYGSKDEHAVSDLFIRVGRISFYICCMVLGLYIAIGNDFISLWVGPQYSDAFAISLVVMIPMTIDICQNLGLTILQVENKYYFRGWVYLSVSVANVFLTVMLLNVLGLFGAALSTAIAMFVGNGLIMNWYYWRHLHLDIRSFWKSLFPIFLQCFVCSCFACLFNGAISQFIMGVSKLIAVGVFYCFAYAVVAFFLTFNDYEKQLSASFLSKLKGLLGKIRSHV